MDEFDIIARFFAPLAGEGAFGLKDDVARLPQRPGHDLIATTDTITQGIDFFAADPADTMARKALRVNLSDLAAKGAQPAGYLLNLSLPRDVTQDWLEAFASGLAHDQKEFGLSLLGGDTGATDGPLSIAVTAFGHVPQGRMVTRGGARVGDAVYVTGTIGDSAGGLAVLKGEGAALPQTVRDHLVDCYRVPRPQVGFATRLRDIAHAGIDVSDGLIADLGHVACASGLRIVVEGEAVPLSEQVKVLWGGDALLRAVTAGDDYQIAFTAPRGQVGPFACIGRAEKGEGVVLTVGSQEIVLPKMGYRHFENRRP
jgi:thiamine-monophosphate kinase